MVSAVGRRSFATSIPSHERGHHGTRPSRRDQRDAERRLNDGRVVRAGDYIHEPAGNVDWWEATGNEELIVHVVVKGEVEYLGAHRRVLQRISAADRLEEYHRHCALTGAQPRALR